MTPSRKRFLAAIGATATMLPGAALAAPTPPAIDAPIPAQQALSDALVLSGGAARGAFQAGVICALAERGGIADGQPLHPYGLVCGSSIGAINAWFVSTGHYTALRRAWSALAAANIVALKRKYAAITKPGAFGGERLYDYLHLALGVAEHEQAIAQSEPILKWMAEHMDPQAPVVTPMVWAVTNMTTQSGEYFYRLPPAMVGQIPPAIEHALHVTLGASTVIRPAADELLHRALLASAAVPVLFDPVVLPMVDGSTAVYVDGSIVASAAVSIARTIASNVDVILVDAQSGRSTYPNALAVVVGAYATMQRDILETAMREIYFQALENRAYAVKPGDSRSRIRYLRPAQSLTSDVNAFTDQAELDTMFALGEQAAGAGFTPYVWSTFRL